MDASLDHRPIAVFDSGLGGLTVLRALQARLPQEDFLYFADARFLPYGDKSESFLRERLLQIAGALARRGAKALVVACNTATVVAAEAIRAAISVPVVALEPGVKPAATMTRTGVVGVLATKRTLASERFRRLVDSHARHVQIVAQPCSGLAEAIETEGADGPTIARLLDAYLAPLVAAGADVIVLGCTHYPWAAAAIARRMSPGTILLDTGESVARQLERLLLAGKLHGGGRGRLTLVTSGEPQPMMSTVNRLFGQDTTVEHWEPDQA